MDPTTIFGFYRGATIIVGFLGANSVYTLVLFPAIWGLCMLLRTHCLRWQLALWVLVLLRCLLPTDLSMPYSARGLTDRVVTAYASVLHPGMHEQQPDTAAWKTNRMIAAIVAENSGLANRRATVQTASAGVSLESAWQTYLAAIWLVGFGVMAACFLLKRRAVARLAHHSVPVADPDVWALAFGLQRTLRIRRRVRIACSAQCRTPFTLGIFQPIVVLPATLLAPVEMRTMRAVIAHELVHIKRLDDLWIRLQGLIQAVFFFHPVVWYANRRIHLLREQICDTQVITRSSLPAADYAAGVLNTLKAACGVSGELPAAAGLDSPRQKIETRIRNILEANAMSPRQYAILMAVTVLMGVFLLPMAPFQSAADAQNQANSAFVHDTEGWFALKFDPGTHVRTQLPPSLWADSLNPNLKKPLVQQHTYAESLQTANPGIEYDTEGAPVRAVAAGIVHFIGETKKTAAAPGGFYVRIAHDLVDGMVKDSYPRATLYRNQAYRSSYYYLSRVTVKHWQAIQRGGIVGYGTRLGAGGPTVTRLVLEELGNWVNPDNYGEGHGFMTYKDDARDVETTLEEMNRRLERQNYLVRELNAYYGERETDDIYAKIHTVIDTEKFKDFPVRWSTLERFRYLGHMYGTRPDLFLGLPAERFAGLEKSFYAHQPIVLTLPFER